MYGKTTLRFFVSELTKRAYNPEHAAIILKPAYNNGSGNEAWSEATPSGEITLNVNNPSAVKWFEACLNDKADIHITMERVADIE